MKFVPRISSLCKSIAARTSTGCLLPVLVLFLVALLSAWAVAGETKYYDAKGRYVGKKDAAGQIFDNKGHVLGRKNRQGRVYDDKGRYRGREAPSPAPNDSALIATPN